MRATLIALMLAALVMPANAQAIFLNVPPNATCEWIIANQETTPDAMIFAGGTYFHGQHMGKPCVKIDYIRAYELTKRSGNAIALKTMTRLILKRAEDGSNRAQKAVKQLGLK